MSIFCREKVLYSDDRRMTLVEAVLKLIKFYLDIGYWNYYQQDTPSPFDNTGVNYHNKTFIVRAYDWVGDNSKPNFEYKDFKVWWYKYCGRGMVVKTTHSLTTDFLIKMSNDCIEAINKDFANRKAKDEGNNRGRT